jgi:hypothetical protein
MAELNIYDFGILVSSIVAIVFLVKDDKQKALIVIVIFLSIMLLKNFGI